MLKYSWCVSEKDEGTSVQCVGVHVRLWRPETNFLCHSLCAIHPAFSGKISHRDYIRLDKKPKDGLSASVYIQALGIKLRASLLHSKHCNKPSSQARIFTVCILIFNHI